MMATREAVGRLHGCPACGAACLVPARSYHLPPASRRRLLLGLGAGLVAVAVITFSLRLMELRPAEQEPAAGLPRREMGEVSTYATALAAAKAPRLEDVAKPGARDWESEHRALNRKYEELANWVLNNMRGRFLLKDKFVKNLQFPSMTTEFGLHPELMEYLEVNDRERGLLEDAMDYGLATMATLESRFLSVTQRAPEHVLLHIPPYVREGAVMQDDLYRAMETVLGADRFDRLLAAGEKDLVKRYHYFGTAARTMTFELTAADDPKDPPFLAIRDGWVIPDGPGKRNVQVTEAAVRELPREYLPYLSWLPEYMAAFVAP